MSFSLDTWNKDWVKSANEDEKMEFRDFLVSILKEQRMNISFIKSDGSLRQLHCSLHPELLPMKEVKEVDDTKEPRKKNFDVIATFDLEKKAWRSFRLDSIQDFSYNLGDLHV